MVWWKILLWAAVVIAALSFLSMVSSILLPFVLAFIISILLDPSIRKLRRRGFTRRAAVLMVFLIFFAFVGAIVIPTAPLVGQQLENFRQALDEVVDNLSEPSPATLNGLEVPDVDHDGALSIFDYSAYAIRVEQGEVGEHSLNENGLAERVDRLLASNQRILKRLNLPASRQEIVARYIEPNSSKIGKAVQDFFSGFLVMVGSAASKVLLLLFTPIFVYMMLMDLETFKVRSASWIPPSIRAETVSTISDIGQVFVSYLRGVVITIGLYVIVMAILLSALGAPYSLLLALLFGAFYLIPYVGPLLSTLVLFVATGFKYAYAVIGGTKFYGNPFFSFNDSWIFALVLATIFLVCHFLYDSLVYPRMVGKAVGLNPLVSMFVIFSGGAMFGLVGMIFAFPVAGSIKVILEKLLRVTTSPTIDSLDLPPLPLRHRTATDV